MDASLRLADTHGVEDVLYFLFGECAEGSGTGIFHQHMLQTGK